MKRFLNRYWKACASIAFGIAVFLFWRFGYYYALSYQEQFQLFLFDEDYFWERMSHPGGFAQYLSEFLVQFYNNVTSGAIILAVLFVILQRLTWYLMIRYQREWNEGILANAYALSFFPAIALWFFMGNENVMLSYVVALLLVIVYMLYKPKLRWVLWAYLLVGIPVMYWLIGPMVLLAALYLMPLSAVYALACIFVSAYCLPYPLKLLVKGIDYYRLVDVIPYSLLLVPVLVLVVLFGVHYLHGIGKKVGFSLAALTCILAVMAGYWGYDRRKYDLIEYDYLVRINDWKGIIAKAEKKNPNLPMSVCATNLALAKTNQLGDRIFDFYQHGREGLIPKFERQFAISQMTGELYFHLGLVNTAQRLAFESMESLPNCNKSARVMKRLAETNLINGQYNVARKYLFLLQKTVFYRPWATRMLLLLGDEQKINQHPLYGWLRKARLQDDILFSEEEIDKICGQLFLQNPKNTMAMQYLLMLPLLKGDINWFMQYLQVVQENVPYNSRVCQEVACLAYAQRNQQPPQGYVSMMVWNNFSDFMQSYQSSGGNRSALERFRNTAWYYLMMGE